jgi:hypothetical protein
MDLLRCIHHEEYFGLQGAIEHLRRFHVSFINRPGRPGEIDTHDHMWYCFDCRSAFKDHRSYNSDTAMWSHLTDSHSDIVLDIVRF